MNRRSSTRAGSAVIAATVLAGVLATSALAASIVGTSGNDTLRGTPKADRLLGKAGNDRLHGLGGADYLNGGAGSDRFFCGAGRDTVIVDQRDVVAADCEVVRRSPAPVPIAPPPPVPPPPPPPPPPAPPAPLAKPGFFGGFASTGGNIHFTVAADGRSFSGFKFDYQAECVPPGRLTDGATYTGSVTINPDRTFSADGGTDGLTVKFSGSFDATGTVASGRFQVHRSLVHDGTHYECDSGGADWSARWQG